MPTTQVSAASSPPRHGGFLSAFRLTACGRLSAQKGVEPFTAQTDGSFVGTVRADKRQQVLRAFLFLLPVASTIHNRKADPSHQQLYPLAQAPRIDNHVPTPIFSQSAARPLQTYTAFAAGYHARACG